MKSVDHTFAVAPMMDWTDRYCRFLHRLLSQRAVLYTEMVTTKALKFGDASRHLEYFPQEHPVVLQLGGSDPDEFFYAGQLAKQYGYDEININVGCPSDRVQSGRFGACLMAEPILVGECVKALQESSGVPVSVKTRLGIDDQDSYEFLLTFLDTVNQAGCTTFILHARKALLQGLSPKENREIPPLDYAKVYRVKKERPHLTIIINGGIKTMAECQEHLQYVDGVMVGREAYENPGLLCEVDRAIFQQSESGYLREALVQYVQFCEAQINLGVTLGILTKPLLGLFQGVPGARAFRRFIAENAHQPGADATVLITALQKVWPHEGFVA